MDKLISIKALLIESIKRWPKLLPVFIITSVAPFIFVNEDLSGFSALKRSKYYIKGRWFAVAFRVLSIWLIYILAFLSVSLLVALTSKFGLFSYLIVGVYVLLVYVGMPLLVLTYYFLLYEDLKRTKEQLP